jgi:hypothetical protein
MNPRVLRDSPPSQAGVGLEMLSPGGYIFIIIRMSVLSTRAAPAQGYVLTPGRYVGAAELEEDDEPFEEKLMRLTAELEAQFEESEKLEKQIRDNWKKLDYVG